MTSHANSFSRRGFLEVLGLSASGLALREVFRASPTLAASAEPTYLLLVYFGGGWDQLLALDPRNATDAKYQRSGSGAPPPTGIEPAYEASGDETPFVRDVLTATAGSGVQTRGNLTFGPAIPEAMLAHAADLCIIRGVNMDTVTHEVGRRYLLTGKFPRGVVANGSSLNTVVTSLINPSSDMPNLSMGTETYNEGLPPWASAVSASTYRDLLTVMQQQGTPLSAESQAALERFQDADDSCEQHGYDASGLVNAFVSSRRLARQLINPSKAALFNFKSPPSPELTDLYAAFNLNTLGDLTSSRGRAAMAGQAIVNGVSNVISLQAAGQLDDHADLFGQQAAKQRDGWEALGRLISYLKSKQIPGSNKSFWQRTSMLVFSEFSRTPLLNTRDGRDHHLASSCLLAGPGVRGNTVFGATSDAGMGVQKWNFSSGALDTSGGSIIRPADVHATLLKSMGLSSAHLSNQSPKLIQRVLM